MDDENTTERFVSLVKEIFANNWKGREPDVDSKKQFVWGKIMSTQDGMAEGSTNFFWVDYAKSNTIVVTCNPVEPVVLVFPAKNKTDQDAFMYIPAIYYRYVIEKQASDNLKGFVTGGLHAASVFTSAGLLIKGVGAIQKIIASVELANAVANVVLLDDNIRNQIKVSPEGEKFLEMWPKISIAIDVATLTAFVQNGRKLLKDYDNVLPDLEKQVIKKEVDRCDAVLVVQGGRGVFGKLS